jgi:hypothetical protein
VIPRCDDYAFPSLADPTDPHSLAPGMTIREFAAIEAMKGLLANPAVLSIGEAWLGRKEIVSSAVELADMLVRQLEDTDP